MAVKTMDTGQALKCIFDTDTSDEVNSSGSEYDPRKDKGDYSDSSDEEYKKSVHQPKASQITIPTSHKSNENDNVSTSENGEQDKSRSRKRQRNPSEWCRRKQKLRRNSGLEYLNRSGKEVAAKAFKPTTCKCSHLKCCERVTEEQRKQMHQAFYATGDWNVQTQIILSSVAVIPVKTRKTKTPTASHKQNTRLFYLSTPRGRVRVCKNVFLSTFGISNKRLDYAVRNKGTPDTRVTIPDQRGNKTPSNKTSLELVDSVKQHINSFPKFCSHYSQRDSDRLYLHPNLNIATMYSMYKRSCDDKNLTPVSHAVYTRIFNTCFNLTFYRPQKDTCKICDVSKVKIDNPANAEELEETKTFLGMHMERADQGRMCLADDIQKSRSESDIHVLTFDLQRTLPIPHLNTNEVFYLRQMWLYNLGIHHYPSDIGVMNTWNECEGKRGSNEIGSCLFDYMSVLPDEIHNVITYSDTCGGQNRNFPIACTMIYAVNSIQNLESIDMKFMESGHSFLPNDTDFGAISRKAKARLAIYTPAEWIDIIKSANKKKPFEIREKHRQEFRCFKALGNQVLVNRKKNIEGETVSWLKIKWMRFSKGSMSMKYKYSLLLCDPFLEVDFVRNRRAVDASLRSIITFDPPPAYPQHLPLKKEKYEDLQKLLKYVPPVHHYFYESLPHIQTATDEIAAYPDLDETSDEEVNL